MPRFARRWSAVLLSAFLIAGSAYVVVATQRARGAANQATSAVRIMTDLQTIQYLVAQQSADLASYLANGELLDAQSHAAVVSEMSAELRTAEGDSPPAWLEAIQQIAQQEASYRSTAAQVIHLVAARSVAQARELDQVELESTVEVLQYRISQLSDQTSASGLGHTRQIESDAASLGEVAPILLALAWLIGMAYFLALGRYQRRLTLAARTDPLTRLANRTELRTASADAIARAGRSSGTPVMLLLDLDRFKEVNDTLGHHSGDELLVLAGERIRAGAPARALVARLGGDEFAVLLPDGSEAGGREVAERIRRSILEPFVLEGMTLELDVSVGIAVHTSGQSSSSLLREADVAMYVAKETRAGVAVYSATLDAHTTERLGLMAELRHALDHDELVVHYQPKVRVADGSVVGAEALVRWQHPGRGLLPPAEFVPQVETTQLIHRLTYQVLTKSLGQCRSWLDRGMSIPVAVNVASRCFTDPEFPATVAELLVRFDLAPSMLVLEITETSVMTDLPKTRRALETLKAIGVGLAVDDYGTGYSTMAYLRDLPVTELKIDRYFVRDIAANGADAALVRSVIELGHNLGLEVVAEGVEEQATQDQLRILRCDLAQGYGIARPMAPSDFERWLRGDSSGALAVRPSEVGEGHP